MAPARSLRTTFSQTSALCGTRAKSDLSSIRSAVLARWLWHVTQYLSRSARCGVADSEAGVGCGAAYKPPTTRAHTVNQQIRIGGPPPDRKFPSVHSIRWGRFLPHAANGLFDGNLTEAGLVDSKSGSTTDAVSIR